MRSDVIGVRLHGGLGNQLFQFAACLARQRHDGPTPVDSTGLSRTAGWYGQLGACLKCGAVRELSQTELLTLRQVPRLPKGMSRLRRYREHLSSRLQALDRYVFDEAPEIRFDPRILHVRAPVLLRGYFQDERYFAEVGDELRKRFRSPSFAADAWFTDCAEASLGRPLIAIGFRDGADYEALGWILPDEYYRNALRMLGGQPGDYAFAVFGDSPEVNMSRARRLLGPECSITGAHHLDAVDQLFAMAMFDTLIIPNSSFSWWGAWLADFDHAGGARVLAPDPWLDTDATAPVPDRWVKVGRPASDHRLPV